MTHAPQHPSQHPQSPQSPQSPHSASSPPQTLGSRGEELAAEYLVAQGFRILARNWQSRYGEIDLVAQDQDTLVAVEVKTRGGTGYGHPLTAITARKAARLRRLLYEWAKTHRSRAEALRIDAVGILILPGLAPQLDHLRGIA